MESIESGAELFETFRIGLIGLPLSHYWRGVGSTIFLEFGGLSPTKRSDGSEGNPDGEFGLILEWSWRVEGSRSILAASESDEAVWPIFFRGMLGTKVTDAHLFGRLSEICVELENDTRVVFFSVTNGDPLWALADKRGKPHRWLSFKDGRFQTE